MFSLMIGESSHNTSNVAQPQAELHLLKVEILNEPFHKSSHIVAMSWAIIVTSVKRLSESLHVSEKENKETLIHRK